MRKISTTIGKALTGAYILYSCRKEPKSGYRLMTDARDILLTGWSAGSFYPTIQSLVKAGMLTREVEKGKRVAHAYRTTPEGMEYLRKVSGYFKNRELKAFFASLLEGRF